MIPDNKLQYLRTLIDEIHKTIHEIRTEYNQSEEMSYLGIGNTQQMIRLYNLAYQINNIIHDELITEARYLMTYIEGVVGVTRINHFDFGGIMAILGIIKEKVYGIADMSEQICAQTSRLKCKPIFISHSSKDKELIEMFVRYILQNGMGFSADDIFCTSIEEMGIKNGLDIRDHIQTNIKYSRYSFLLLSDSYKNSEICLNEMGAVWLSNSKVYYLLLPNFKVSSIGWLSQVKMAHYIDNAVLLDKIHEDMISNFNLSNNTSNWSGCRQKFIEKVHQIEV